MRISSAQSPKPTVLILVLVEDGLGGQGKSAYRVHNRNVLILVLVEDGLGVIIEKYIKLNDIKVLILVLVEDGLGGVIPNGNPMNVGKS